MEQTRAQIRPVVHIVGIILVVVAALKLFGIHIPVPGNISELALVGIGLLHV